MNGPISAALLLVLLSATWLLGRRPSRPFLRSTDTTDVAALNRAQIERLRETPQPPAPSVATDAAPVLEDSAGGFPGVADSLPRQPRQRRDQLRRLEAWLQGSREQRLKAVAVLRACDQACVLPLLRRALRDPDPAVMAEAAAGMARFRGRSQVQPAPTLLVRRVSSPISSAAPRPGRAL